MAKNHIFFGSMEMIYSGSRNICFIKWKQIWTHVCLNSQSFMGFNQPPMLYNDLCIGEVTLTPWIR